MPSATSYSWTSNNGHFYVLYLTPKTWDAASAFALVQGGYLSKIDSAAENSEIFAKINTLLNTTDRAGTTASDGGDGSYVWLGASDAATEGSWIWRMDGSALSRTDAGWGKGSLGSEPDNYLGNQDYLALGLVNWPMGSSTGAGYGNAGQWNDLSGSNQLYFLVEYNTAPATGDTQAPQLLGASPGGSNRLAAVGDNIVLTFDENVQASGTLVLKSNQGQVFESFNLANDARVKISGATITLDPTANLVAGARYTLDAIGLIVTDATGNMSSAANTLLTAFKVTPPNLVTRNGTVAGEQIGGTSGNDLINLLDGNDIGIGVLGDDVIYGGAGNDKIFAVYTGQSTAAGDDYFDGGAGDDYLLAGAGNDILDGGVGDDTLTAGAGDDILYGADGKDVLDGGGGADTAVFPLARSAYTLVQDGPAWLVTNAATKVTVTLASIEKIQFSDQNFVPAAAIDFANASGEQQKTWVTQNLNALLYTGQLRIAGSVISYSFEATSFLTSPSNVPAGEAYVYQAATPQLQTFLRETFEYLARVLNVSFVEKTSGTGAQIKIGMHNMDVGGYGAPPDHGATAGNLLISTKNPVDTLGQSVFKAAVHELGHVLGLDHTQNRTVSSGGGYSHLPDVALPIDTGALSVMSYQFYMVNGQSTSTFAPLDISALQTLYGRNTKDNDSTFLIQYNPVLTIAQTKGLFHNFGETVSTLYAYSPTMISDTGGNDLIDLTGFLAPATMDLSNGAIYRQELSSGTVSVYETQQWVGLDLTQPLVRIDPFTVIERVTGTKFNDSLKGAASVETLNGAAGDDSLMGMGGDDVLDGGSGLDTAAFVGQRKDYVLDVAIRGAETYISDKVSSRDGRDTLLNFERLSFSDVKVALDLGGNTGQVVKILGVVFGSSAVTNKSYVGIGLSYLDTGMSYVNLMQLAIDARLGGRGSNTDVVNLLYTNVVGSTPDAGTLVFYKGLLDNGTYTQGAFGVLVADSFINTMHINLVGLAQAGVEYV